MTIRLVIALGASGALAACDAAPTAPDDQQSETPQDAFFAALSSHCGKAFAGQLVSEDAADADFADKAW